MPKHMKLEHEAAEGLLQAKIVKLEADLELDLAKAAYQRVTEEKGHLSSAPAATKYTARKAAGGGSKYQGPGKYYLRKYRK